MRSSYTSLLLPYITKVLAFESDEEAHEFLASHDAAIYANPTLSEPSTTLSKAPKSWKPIQRPKPTPLVDLKWDAKKAVGQITAGLEKYRIVDLKGQIV
jgi:hypothetical protein